MMSSNFVLPGSGADGEPCLLCRRRRCSIQSTVVLEKDRKSGVKILLEYLNINVSTLLPVSKQTSFKPWVGGGDESMEVSLMLCEDCSGRTDAFLKLYEKSEMARLKLVTFTYGLGNYLRDAGGSVGVAEEEDIIVLNNIVGKCNSRLTGIPRVPISRISLPRKKDKHKGGGGDNAASGGHPVPVESDPADPTWIPGDCSDNSEDGDEEEEVDNEEHVDKGPRRIMRNATGGVTEEGVCSRCHSAPAYRCKSHGVRCKVCKKRFHDMRTLLTHIRAHPVTSSPNPKVDKIVKRLKRKDESFFRKLSASINDFCYTCGYLALYCPPKSESLTFVANAKPNVNDDGAIKRKKMPILQNNQPVPAGMCVRCSERPIFRPKRTYDRSVTCKICKKKVSDRRALQLHVRVHRSRGGSNGTAGAGDDISINDLCFRCGYNLLYRPPKVFVRSKRVTADMMISRSCKELVGNRLDQKIKNSKDDQMSDVPPPAPPSLRCTHCDHASFNPKQHQKHVLCSHPEILCDELREVMMSSKGSSPAQLESVIQGLMKEMSDGGNEYGCNICNTDFLELDNPEDYVERRAHILEAHHATIIRKLQEEKSSPSHKAKIRKLATSWKTPVVCTYCGKTSSQNKDNRQHCLCKHTALYLKDTKQIPEGTTRKSLDEAIKSVLSQGLVVKFRKNESEKRHHCPFCPANRRQRALLRTHVLDCHFQEIHKRLVELEEQQWGHNDGVESSPVVVAKKEEVVIGDLIEDSENVQNGSLSLFVPLADDNNVADHHEFQSDSPPPPLENYITYVKSEQEDTFENIFILPADNGNIGILHDGSIEMKL